MRIAFAAFVLAALPLLAGCGEWVGTRATTGAIGGAVAGTVVGAPLVGAAAGGTVGAATAD